MANVIKYNYSEKTVIYIISTLVGMLITAVAVLIVSAVALAGDLDEVYSSVLSSISMGVGGITAGFLSSRKIRSGGMLNGLFCGLILYLPVFFLSLFLSETGFSMNTVYHFLITILSAVIGGVLGVNKNKNYKI
jgi:putative membrane protein (TIGR04086 family)